MIVETLVSRDGKETVEKPTMLDVIPDYLKLKEELLARGWNVCYKEVL